MHRFRWFNRYIIYIIYIYIANCFLDWCLPKVCSNLVGFHMNQKQLFWRISLYLVRFSKGSKVGIQVRRNVFAFSLAPSPRRPRAIQKGQVCLPIINNHENLPTKGSLWFINYKPFIRPDFLGLGLQPGGGTLWFPLIAGVMLVSERGSCPSRVLISEIHQGIEPIQRWLIEFANISHLIHERLAYLHRFSHQKYTIHGPGGKNIIFLETDISHLVNRKIILKKCLDRW